MDINNIPVGTVFETLAYQYYLPEWYLHVRGQALKVIDYPELFRKIGWQYRESHDSRDTFRLPPFEQGRFYIIKVKEAIHDKD
jgi:hypothetical protein